VSPGALIQWDMGSFEFDDSHLHDVAGKKSEACGCVPILMKGKGSISETCRSAPYADEGEGRDFKIS